MSSSKISASNVFLALVDLEKPSRAVDVTDYLAGETGADSRCIASTVCCQLDQLVRRGCIAKKNNLYMVIRDEKTIQERLRAFEVREFRRPHIRSFKLPPNTITITTTTTTTNGNGNTNVVVGTVNGNGLGNGMGTGTVTGTGNPTGMPKTNVTESSIKISGCMSIAAIPPQIRRENPVLSTTMSEMEIKYTQRFWKKPLFGNK